MQRKELLEYSLKVLLDAEERRQKFYEQEAERCICPDCKDHLKRIEELERQNEQLKILLEQSKWSADEDN